MVRATLFFLGLAVLAAPAPAAPPGDGERWAYDLAHELMSPYCPGRALAECPSPQADQLRLWILSRAEAGASREAVERELFDHFGDAIRQAPRAEGIGLVAYAVPAVFVVAGAALLVVFLRRGVGA